MGNTIAPGSSWRQHFRRMGWFGLFSVLLIPGILLAGVRLQTAQGAKEQYTAHHDLKGYVGLFEDDAVAVFDLRTNQVLRLISVPSGPLGLAATPDGRWVYVSSEGAASVSVINTRTDQVEMSIAVGQAPHDLAISPDGQVVLAAVYGADQVVRIDTRTNEITGKAPMPRPHHITINPDGQTACIATQQPGNFALVILKVSDMTRVSTITVPNLPRAANFSPDGKQLYFTLAGVNDVQVLDPASHRMLAHIPVGLSSYLPLFSPKGNIALLILQDPGLLAFISPAKHLVTASVPVGKFPNWVAATADGRTAYVTNEGSNTVSVIDLHTRHVSDTISIGNAPRRIVVVQLNDK